MSKDNSKKNKKVYLDPRFYYCLVIAIFVFFALFYSLLQRNYIFTDNTSKHYEHKWFYEDGTEVDFNSLSEETSYTISKSIEKGTINNKSLCFYSKNVYFTVFLDGKAIYDFHPKPPRLFGKSYGIFPHAVTLPVLYESSLITISIDNIYPDTPGYIRNISLANGNNFIISEMKGSAPEFILCSIVFALGIAAFVIGIAGRYFGERRYEIISMGTFAMVSSIWIATESSFFPLLVSSPVTIHFVDYMMLAVLPLPTVLFASFVTGNKDSKVGMIIGLMSSVNLLAQILLTSLKIQDYHKMLWVSHVVLALTVLCVIYLFIKSIIQKKLTRGILIVLTISFLFPLLIGAFELVRYRISPSDYRGTPAYQYVLFLFIFLCCVYEFISISEMSRKGQYAEIMEKLAYSDGLTGLLNREAYNKFVDSELPEGSTYTIVMLDMNDLKKVNDKYGHQTGDEYIKRLSSYIKESFSENGNVYRMGGDEFLVISTLSSVDIDFLESLDKMYSKIEEFNSDTVSEIPLSVAVGYADYSVGGRSIKEALREADSKMYERKKKMKE